MHPASIQLITFAYRPSAAFTSGAAQRVSIADMPMSYTIDQDARFIRVYGSGVLTDDEMLQCVTALRADPALQPDMQTLSDMRDIEVGFSAEGVMRMVEVLKKTDSRRAAVKVAIVVSSDAAFGMGRVFEGWSDEQVESKFRVFRHMEQADQWLASNKD